MITNIFKKYFSFGERKRIIQTIIQNLNIHEKQKKMYLESLDMLDEKALEKLYITIQTYLEEVEKKDMQEIARENFVNIAGMRKKEAKEKQKELNTLSFLFRNL